MCRLAWPVTVGLFVALTTPLAAQRPPVPALTLEEPRPLPVLPAVMVPFSVPSEFCQDGARPVTSLRVFNTLVREVAALRLRSDDREELNGAEIGCGDFVGVWDGAIDGGTRLARSAVYYIQLAVSLPGLPPRRLTVKLLVPRLN